MVIADHAELLAMMERTPGICVREADQLEPTRVYLARNPAMSFVACVGGAIVGCAMAGHDGRRGYLNHVMVDERFRHRGIATALVERCLAALRRAGIGKVHLEVVGTNESGQEFWKSRGWVHRTENARFSLVISDNANA